MPMAGGYEERCLAIFIISVRVNIELAYSIEGSLPYELE